MARVIGLAVPDEPLLVRPATARGQGDVTARGGAVRGPALDNRSRDVNATGSQTADVPQEQQGARLDGVQGRGYLPHGDRGRDRVVIEGEDEQGAGRAVGERVRSAVSQRVHSAVGERVHGVRPDVHLDPEMLARVLARAVDARRFRVGVHGLEADAELPDLGQVAGLLAGTDPADAADVGFGEGAAVVPYLQAIVEELEGQLGRARVLRVLDQLEDEVRALAVELPEQVQHRRVPAVPGDVLVADRPARGLGRRSGL